MRWATRPSSHRRSSERYGRGDRSWSAGSCTGPRPPSPPPSTARTSPAGLIGRVGAAAACLAMRSASATIGQDQIHAIRLERVRQRAVVLGDRHAMAGGLQTGLQPRIEYRLGDVLLLRLRVDDDRRGIDCGIRLPELDSAADEQELIAARLDAVRRPCTPPSAPPTDHHGDSHHGVVLPSRGRRRSGQPILTQLASRSIRGNSGVFVGLYRSGSRPSQRRAARRRSQLIHRRPRHESLQEPDVRADVHDRGQERRRRHAGETAHRLSSDRHRHEVGDEDVLFGRTDVERVNVRCL